MARKGLSEVARKGTSAAPPRRRPSAAVYRRRRLVALVLLVLLAGGLTAGGVALANVVGDVMSSAESSSGTPSGDTADAPAASTRTANAAKASSAPVAGCDESRVVVTASMDAVSYAAGKNPLLTLTVTNRGKAVCDVNVGTAQMEFLITSGNDRIFSSADCQVGAVNLVKALGPGKSEKANFQWRRNRTAPGCSPVESKPGVGYYKFQARLGERESKLVSFQLS